MVGLGWGVTTGVLLMKNSESVEKIKELTDITRIDKEQLYYMDEGVEKAFDLRTSANRWWDLYHKTSLLDKLFGRKKKNIYVGEKYFCVDGVAYFKFFW